MAEGDPKYDPILGKLREEDDGTTGPTGPTGPVGTLNSLTDVDITSVADYDLLQYNVATGKWENRKTMKYDNDYKAYLITEK